MAATYTKLDGPDDGGNMEHSWQGSYLQAHLLSDVGKKRNFNEDRCVVSAPEHPDAAHERGVLFAVADGMGGVSGGGFASRLALDALVDEYFTGDSPSICRRLRQSIEVANRRIFEEAFSQPQYAGMGTTVSAMLVHGDNAYVAQVGDSRVYLFRGNNSIWQITDDHSLVAEQVRNGFLSEQEARTHSLKNLITRAVGTREIVNVDLFSVRIKRGDTMLICSDGLSNLVEDRHLVEAMSMPSLQAAARTLVGRALDAGGSDNITVVLIRVNHAPPKTRLEEGAIKVSLTTSGFLTKLRRFMS